MCVVRLQWLPPQSNQFILEALKVFLRCIILILCLQCLRPHLLLQWRQKKQGFSFWIYWLCMMVFWKISECRPAGLQQTQKMLNTYAAVVIQVICNSIKPNAHTKTPLTNTLKPGVPRWIRCTQSSPETVWFVFPNASIVLLRPLDSTRTAVHFHFSPITVSSTPFSFLFPSTYIWFRNVKASAVT